MKNLLLGMLGTLMMLAAYAEVTPVKDFNLEKAAGKWYMVGYGSNAEWFVNNKATMKMGTAVLLPTDDGDLDLSYATLNADGTCWRMSHLANRTETPGRFAFHSLIWHNDNDMRIVDILYDDYALVHTIKTKDGVSMVFNTLYSRTQEASENVKQKFIQFSLKTGVLPENTVILPKNDECPEI